MMSSKIQCRICKSWKSENDFYKKKNNKTWRLSECKDCFIKKASLYQKNHPEIWKKTYQNSKEKRCEKIKQYKVNQSIKIGFNWINFHAKTNRYIKQKNLYPNQCLICWQKWKIETHHPFYNSFGDWKYVTFCCHSCHKLIHNNKLHNYSFINLLKQHG